MPVTVEVRVDRGIHFLMVGLPDSAVRESQQRIKSAIEHLGFRWPGKGITINLAPAGLRKEGAEHSASLRQLKTSLKEVGDGLGAHKREVRRDHAALDARNEAYDAAFGTLAEHLKIANPVAAALGAAAAAL